MLLKTPAGYSAVIYLPLQLNMRSKNLLSSCLAAVAVPPLIYTDCRVWVHMTFDAMLCAFVQSPRVSCITV